ncbi:hypothetical protein F5Y06DRAFT_44040 [Hypoxylon sp. FL0890]|nr:hypothetical protein F5Y06DRAFT_44040 [Hypoxylon sp. FL0890]
MSGIVNKVKDAVTGHHSSSTTHSSAPEGTHGPHGSRVTNAADPRVDSDRDHRAAPGSTVGGTQTYTSGNNYTHSGTTGSATAGPHQSDLANKVDPRVDSDRDGRFVGNTAGDYGGSGREGVAGPHNSRLANAADPRVDSDRDGSRTVGNTYGSSGTAGTTGAGYTPAGTTGNTFGSSTGAGYGSTTGTHGHGTTGTTGIPGTTGTHGVAGTHGTTGTHGVTGTHGTTGTHGVTGTHGTTGTHGVAGTHTAHSGPGPAPDTAGPHKSNIANKLDPRVDSDLDNSRTVGGNKTYQS